MSNILELKNLSKSFGGIHAVNNVSFGIKKGEILGLIGPNGSGKTTTVNLISGVYEADSGEILYKGKNIVDLPITERAKLGIGRTFQAPKPFTNLTVYESVFTAALLYNKSYQDAHRCTSEVLDFAGLTQSANEKSGSLPIEMRKWLDLARVLAIKPDIVMLDEVLAGLNPSEMVRSVELVKKVNELGITIIFIEHVMKAVTTLCDRVVVLNQGKLLSSGIPSDVMKQKVVIEAYLGGGYANAEN